MIPISLKPGVRLTDLHPQMVLATLIMVVVFEEFGAPEFVITSINDGKHSPASKHYKGCGEDIRTKFPGLDGLEYKLRDVVRARLGPDFDVVMEAVDTDNEHLHVEYDPKPSL